jgi:hypothetical protein
MKNKHSTLTAPQALAVLSMFIFLVAWTTVGQSQEANPPAAATSKQTQGAVSTGGVHAAVLDTEKRPITAGGFVDSGPVVFQEVAEKAGLTKWKHVMGTDETHFILETVGSGVAIIDYDNDGWPDIYLVNGSTYDAMAGKATPPHAALFHNNHDGTFTNVAEKAGVTNDRWGFGVAVGVISGGSYASSNDLRVHFGLGKSTEVEGVEIHWPSGAVERLKLPAVDRFYSVEEGRGISAANSGGQSLSQLFWFSSARP